jgi:hypothetical protein
MRSNNSVGADHLVGHFAQGSISIDVDFGRQNGDVCVQDENIGSQRCLSYPSS